MDDFPSIDELARRLTELGALEPGQWEEFKRLELSALASERSEDALMLFGRLGKEDPAKRAMEAGLADLRSWAKERLEAAPERERPRLTLVCGAPGSGKSAMMERLAQERPETLLATADDFKARFKARLPEWIGETPEPARSNLGRSVYIHRLTSLPSWEMVDEAIERRVDVAVEMLGMGAAEDARTIRRALAKGYEARVIHIGCSVEASLARAARRHFEQKARGEEGRWVGLAAAAGRQRALLAAFGALKELLADTEAKLCLIDNTDFSMKPIWRSEDGGAPPVDRFASWRADPALWREGVNPAADLCALCKDEQGVWRVALVERGSEPFKGKLAFPGGFIKGASAQGPFAWGQERAQDAALRRFAEETLCAERPSSVRALGKFDALERDPRNTPGRWVESWVFAARFERCEELKGGDSARSARWVSVEEALGRPEQLAFDHGARLREAVAALEAAGEPASQPAAARPRSPR